ncbi:uncharacterized protein LOC115242542 [Formica exsecta]|uniref:uncharacterized protein LOC115242542 n=1 Tax=Formica exsecta TaxID=72781 RepID=UPI00114457A8|nr:uncharacterized protein LOC115242542 [Formica exsecta]XP_029674789.1 uncharacterized protein LOC115242542 [Formica exsecta]
MCLRVCPILVMYVTKAIKVMLSSQVASFRDELASCFVDNNITHVQGNNFLSLLRKHPCFSYLPKDVRTLLDTPRSCLDICAVPPGEYLHFDLEVAVVDSLSNNISCTSVNKTYNELCRMAEYISLAKECHLELRCFIADAPVRAFILHHRGHMAERPCYKCKISGIHVNTNYFIFNGINHPLRTDDEYIRRFDDAHHKDGASPLSRLPMEMVYKVLFEYMHLVCIGVMKKLFQAWVQGKFSRETKLSGRAITVINTKILSLQEYCPSDFARRPRSLELYSK